MEAKLKLVLQRLEQYDSGILKEDIKKNSLYFLAGMMNVTYSIIMGVIIKGRLIFKIFKKGK